MAKFQPSPVEQQRAIVFLDIDDVLAVHRLYNTRQVLGVLGGDESIDAAEVWQQIFHAPARYNLLTLHEEFQPLYVISSSWTLHLNREQLCETFLQTSLDFVVQNLHEEWCTPRDGESYRLTEIEAWLDTHALLTPVPFVVIDDELSGQSLVGSHLESATVFCKESVGFILPQLRHAQQILRGQLTP